MNTRSSLPDSPVKGKRCVYCLSPADTNDHAPPRCLLQPPLPSNLITLPACKKCNNGFSFDENVVRAFIVLISSHPQLITERQPGGWLERTCERNSNIRGMLEGARQADGTYAFTASLVASFERVFRKTLQGVFFGLYRRVVAADTLRLIRMEDRRTVTPEEVIAQVRPSPLRDITDQPLSEISPHSWHTKEPIITLDLQPVSGGQPIRRVLRLVRDTPAEWVHFQPGVFSFAFVKCDDEGCACVFEVWQTLVITLRAPWPHDRGPLRRGRKNPWSRDGKRNS